MKVRKIVLFGYELTFKYGAKEITTVQEVEKAVMNAITRKSANKELSWNGSSWFKLHLETGYKIKKISIIDFTNTFTEAFVACGEDLDDVLTEAKAHFDAIK